MHLLSSQSSTLKRNLGQMPPLGPHPTIADMLGRKLIKRFKGHGFFEGIVSRIDRKANTAQVWLLSARNRSHAHTHTPRTRTTRTHTPRARRLPSQMEKRNGSLSHQF